MWMIAVLVMVLYAYPWPRYRTYSREEFERIRKEAEERDSSIASRDVLEID